MTRTEFDTVCAAMTAVFNVIQWGGASVWKVGGPKGKVFAIHSNWGQSGGVVLKPSDMGREIWRGHPGIGPAPYLGKAGWLKIEEDAMDEASLIEMIRTSYEINAAKLTRAQRSECGILL